MRFISFENSSPLKPIWRLFFTAGVLIVGSDAAPFTDDGGLLTAVQNCLLVDTTGVTCCATADCGPAGNLEMPNWDVSSVTNMNGMFFPSVSLQRGYLQLGRELRDRYGQHVL